MGLIAHALSSVVAARLLGGEGAITTLVLLMTLTVG